MALSHLNQALVLRDQVLQGLPVRLRSHYLTRRDLVALAQIERELRSTTEQPPVLAPSAERVAVRPASDRLLVGEDPTIRGLLEGIRKVGRTDATVLVLGESGTGKELIAEALHEASARRDAPLVKVNCGALVESLLLSELFGHEKGAFTGAVARKRGRFEMAEGGTLFLDEIGDISPATQVALLRVLQERTYERVGGTTPLRANVRIVAATHRDLRGMVERGEFRQDLYFRLSGLVLNVPALRSRLGDLPRLARHLLGRIAAERNEAPRQLSAEALALLARHRWPGNVRELDNALRAASLFAEGTTIEASDLTEHIEALRALGPREVPAAMRSSLIPPSVGSESTEEPAGDDEAPLSGEALAGETSDATETIYA
ncbi:MAG: AAA family ATPase, partial [Myxococcales bacterium]